MKYINIETRRGNDPIQIRLVDIEGKLTALSRPTRQRFNALDPCLYINTLFFCAYYTVCSMKSAPSCDEGFPPKLSRDTQGFPCCNNVYMVYKNQI